MIMNDFNEMLGDVMRKPLSGQCCCPSPLVKNISKKIQNFVKIWLLRLSSDRMVIGGSKALSNRPAIHNPTFDASKSTRRWAKEWQRGNVYGNTALPINSIPNQTEQNQTKTRG